MYLTNNKEEMQFFVSANPKGKEERNVFLSVGARGRKQVKNTLSILPP
jgi:hypothetical protein